MPPIKTSKQIKQDLKKHFDFAVAYGDAIDALEIYEKLIKKLLRLINASRQKTD